MLPCHEEALRLLDLGYRPIAIDPATKAPWYSWKPYQTRQPTPDEIAQWYTERPQAGVGITTEGLVVVDVDGPETVWPPNRECCYDLMGVPQVATPRGGSHYYFRQLRPHSGTIGAIQPHVDTRADGNLVVLPPTRRLDGTRYEWVGEELDCGPAGLATPPDWLQAALDAVGTDRVSLYASQPFGESIPQGQRDKTYFRFACLMRDVGADQQRIFGALCGMAAHDESPLDHRQLAKIAASAAKYSPKVEADVTGITGKVEPPRVLTMQDLEGLPPPTWLIDDVIPDRGLGILVGAPGSGKSLFALAVVNAVARQEPLLGLKSVQRSGWVLVLLAESIASWGARSRAYNDYHGLDPTPDFGAVIDGVNFSSPKAIADLSLVVRQEINRRGDYPALIVLDTVSSAIPGVDENNQAAVTPLLAELNRWVRYGIPVVAIHHPSKGGSAYRGSSAFQGNVDWMIGIEARDGRREIVRHKMRDLEWETPLAFEVVKHAGSIVAVPCAGATPAFMAFSEEGLMDALRDHGYCLAGKDTRRPVRGLDIAKGVTVTDLLTTWGGTKPINPPSHEDREAYNNERSRRRKVLIRVINSLVDEGRLTCPGKLTTRDHDYPITQPGQ
jgi:hypothetical protein